MAFDGDGLFAVDAASVGTVYNFAAETIRFGDIDNTAYPDVVDAAALQHVRSLGLALGTLQIDGFVMGDRGFAAFVTAAFGPRTAGQLAPWLMNLVPYASGTAIKASGIWWSSLQITGRFGTRGSDCLIRFSIRGLVLDPKATLTVPTLTPPGTVGLNGKGISSFDQMSFTDGQGSPTTYDSIRSFGFSLDNRLQIQPSIKSATNRIASGCVPGPIAGSLSLSQLSGATTPIPQAVGTYPIQMIMPTADATATLTLDASVSYDGRGRNLMPNDFNSIGANYTLFSTSAGATASASYPVVATYA
jgi:hypothetical protein